MLDMVVKGLAACAAAFQFLSRLPIPVKLDYNDALFRRSVVFYPLVGVVLGLLFALAGALLRAGFPSAGADIPGTGIDFGFGFGAGLGPGTAAALVLLLWVGLTGALHLDGLMDTADGIFSHRSREQMLDIMKDSRVGAMGVIACILTLLLKWTLLEQWLMLPGTELICMLPLATLWSRWYMVVAIACWPYARREQEGRGIGSFFRGLGVKHLALHTLLALLLSMGLMWLSGGPASPFSPKGLMAVGTAAAGALLIGIGASVYLNRKLGGLTGDTYGAMNELIETALLLLLYIAITAMR
ncbi:adenosylcobinamide-GDP ribazoletransferase [Paenibacillus piri]|uniref:Adenosylcobinamide-GDP ribazoletransferase n=1 Tax=Paenibacillus piri TaxID=2547395 RepID=A0A4R5L014_9BACL|nr:adenosylcobinamide-GDP ribazoletransferase [Paenibacillus piri]TDG00959.1 adenosylcobinamide-GDP ribazoletransferase [Paenibacillus piri]